MTPEEHFITIIKSTFLTLRQYWFCTAVNNKNSLQACVYELMNSSVFKATNGHYRVAKFNTL